MDMDTNEYKMKGEKNPENQTNPLNTVLLVPCSPSSTTSIQPP